MPQEYYIVEALDCYNNKLNTSQAEKELNNKAVGTYLIRDSSYELKKPSNDEGRYFAISFVDNNKEISHKLIYVPHDIKAAIPSAFETPKKPMGGAYPVTNIKEYLAINSDMFKIALVTDQQKIVEQQKSKEQSLEFQNNNNNDARLILNKDTIKDIFNIFTGGLNDWTTKEAQVTSPALAPKVADSEFSKVKEKLKSIGINAENEDLLSLVNSRTEKGKKKLCVNVNTFNNDLTNEKIDNLKNLIMDIRNSYFKTLESGEVGTGRRAYILENHISRCNNVLDQFEQAQRPSLVK